MKYKTVIDSRIVTFDHANEDGIFVLVKKAYGDAGIKYKDEDIRKSISRQKNNPDSNRKRVSFADAVIGAKALIKYSATGGVDYEEIRRRAAICLACPLKPSSVTGCSSCGASSKITKFANALRVKLGLDRPIPPEIKDKFCPFCECSIPLLVVTREEDFKEEPYEVNQKRPDVCWMKK